jgi:predicted DNA-binding ribbon-helix-helix protein
MHRARIPARRIVINGHPTSFRLEPELWSALRRAATEQGLSAKAFVERVGRSKHPSRSLSSELRVAVCGHFQALAPRVGFFDPDTKFAVRLVDDRPRRKRRTKVAA